MTNIQKNSPSLEEALYTFSVDERPVTADVLDEFARRYPEHADALTELAVELALEDASPTFVSVAVQNDVKNPTKVPAVARAMSRFHYQFKAVRLQAEADKTKKSHTQAVENPFAQLDRNQIKAVALQLNVNSPFFIKLRDRLIQVATIPDAFIGRTATALESSIEKIRAHLSAPPIIASTQSFKAIEKPAAVEQQSFRDAVRGSGLTDAQQQDLLKL